MEVITASSSCSYKRRRTMEGCESLGRPEYPYHQLGEEMRRRKIPHLPPPPLSLPVERGKVNKVEHLRPQLVEPNPKRRRLLTIFTTPGGPEFTADQPLVPQPPHQDLAHLLLRLAIEEEYAAKYPPLTSDDGYDLFSLSDDGDDSDSDSDSDSDDAFGFIQRIQALFPPTSSSMEDN